jgi:hypothetical protein
MMFVVTYLTSQYYYCCTSGCYFWNNNVLAIFSDMLDELQEHVESIDMANGKNHS